MSVYAVCRYCNGSGSVVAMDRTTGSLYGFSCYCSAGGKYSALPRWHDRLKGKYTPDCDNPVYTPPEPKVKTEPEPF